MTNFNSIVLRYITVIKSQTSSTQIFQIKWEMLIKLNAVASVTLIVYTISTYLSIQIHSLSFQFSTRN